MHVHNQSFVNGAWQPTAGKTIHKVINPATEEIFAEYSVADEADVNLAVSAARRALHEGPWAESTLEERCSAVQAIQNWLTDHTKELASEVTSTLGLPTTHAAGLFGATRLIDMYVDSIRSLRLEFLRREPTGTTLITRRPVGVVAGISPWNTPVRAEVKKAIPALLAGCTVVLKPAPETPVGAVALAEAAKAIGLPPGVLNVVFGAGETGAALVGHPDVSKVAFTGSTATGQKIGRICGESFTRMQLELGGKSAAIVLEDADLNVALPLLDMANFFNAGQGCVNLTRILVHRSRAAELAEGLVHLAEQYQLGDPCDEKTTMGPLVNRSQHLQVLGYISTARQEGARLLTGGHRPSNLARGFFVEPTVFADVDNSMTIAQQEIFGPVASIITYDTEDEAVAIANDTEYGLNGAVLSMDEEHALAIARRLGTGTVGINRFGGALHAPFGGVKQSGVGREHGTEGFETLLEYRCFGVSDQLASALIGDGVSCEDVGF